MEKKKFEVVVKYESYSTYFVDAETDDDAREIVLSGEAEVSAMDEFIVGEEIREVNPTEGQHRKDK